MSILKTDPAGNIWGTSENILWSSLVQTVRSHMQAFHVNAFHKLWRRGQVINACR